MFQGFTVDSEPIAFIELIARSSIGLRASRRENCSSETAWQEKETNSKAA